MTAKLERLYLSPAHNFFGHHGQPAGEHPTLPASELHCVAGRGIRGDRFFDYRPDYPGQITFFALEVFEELGRAVAMRTATPAALRRNVVTRGLDLLALVGREFCLQGVWFRGACECKPCYWMDTVVAPGAEAWLRGRGGLRARILTDGVLRAGATGTGAAVGLGGVDGGPGLRAAEPAA
jgi:MOSC domain-containing protein YiiM